MPRRAVGHSLANCLLKSCSWYNSQPRFEPCTREPPRTVIECTKEHNRHNAEFKTVNIFNYTIEYKSSNENANADTFSTLPLSTEVKDDSEMETMYYTEVLEALPVSSANISKALTMYKSSNENANADTFSNKNNNKDERSFCSFRWVFFSNKMKHAWHE